MYNWVQGVCVVCCRMGMRVFSVIGPGFWCSNLLDPLCVVSGALMGWSGIVPVFLHAWKIGLFDRSAVEFLF